MKQKTEDYKLSAVTYYNNNDDGYDKTCNIFGCTKSSLKRWIHQYKTRKYLKRKPKNAISYKIKKDQVKTALNILDNNEQYRNNQQMCWGLLKCKTCSTFWNRDCNGAKNIYKITENAIKQIARPDYLCRGTSQAIFKNGYNQNLCGYEKTQP